MNTVPFLLLLLIINEKGGLQRWQTTVPGGADMCGNDVYRLPPRHVNSPRNSHQSPVNAIPTLPRKKRYFNIMWDPRVARGPNLVQFTAAQSARCKHEADLNNSMLLRPRRRRPKHIGTRIVYPDVKIIKEPLTYDSFAPFLTEQTRITTRDAGQSMYGDKLKELPQGPSKMPSGISIAVQTDITPCAQEAEEWIVATLAEKIPEQAILELAEEAELELLKGVRQRHEMVLLYRKWQKMKEDQWNEYLTQWNRLRMGEIVDEDAHLQDHGDLPASVIAFARNAINSCFAQTFEIMKLDGFISKEGVLYEELNEINKIMAFNGSTEERLGKRFHTSRKVLNSVIATAAVRRFADHMNDDFGRPYGRWLSLSQTPSRWNNSIDYDSTLQSYLTGRGARRRGGNLGSGEIRSDISFFDIFAEPDVNSKVDLAGNLYANNVDFTLLAEANLIKGENSVFSDHVALSGWRSENELKNPPVSPANEEEDGYENDVTLLYKRNSRWSVQELQRDGSSDRYDGSQVGATDKGNRTKAGNGLLKTDNDKSNKFRETKLEAQVMWETRTSGEEDIRG